MIEHLTWSQPTENELKQLKKAMFLKAVRLLLSATAIFAVSMVCTLLLNLDIPDIDTRFMAAPVLVIIIIYYWLRCSMVFGRRLCLEEQIMEKTGIAYVWFVVNMLAALIIFIFAGFRTGVLQCILLAVMSVLTYWKESFMLILFILGKYKVKDGTVTYRDDQLGFWGQSGTRVHWLSRVFVLDFEDIAGRKIPVMADWYTYHIFKRNSDAILIRYDFREDSSLLELVRSRKGITS